MSRKTSPVTLKDIAISAGVSHTAVSAALHGTGRIGEGKRQKIISIARRLNYQPRLAAQMLRARRTGHLGLILCGENTVDHMDSGFFSPIVSNFIRVCEERDIRYHIEFSQENHLSGDGFVPPSYMAGGMVDGALIAGFCHQKFAHWLTQENRLPWVSIGEPSTYHVNDDTRQSIYMATQHLVAIGHRRIALLHGDISFKSNEDALRGFKQACGDFHLDSPHQRTQFIPGMPRRDAVTQAAEWAKQNLSAHDRPTAVICMGMGMARAVVSIAQQLQLRVPEQISVLGRGTQAESERSFPCLAFIQPNYQAMVSEALYMLEQLVTSRKIQRPALSIPANLIWHDTVAPSTDASSPE